MAHKSIREYLYPSETASDVAVVIPKSYSIDWLFAAGSPPDDCFTAIMSPVPSSSPIHPKLLYFLFSIDTLIETTSNIPTPTPFPQSIRAAIINLAHLVTVAVEDPTASRNRIAQAAEAIIKFIHPSFHRAFYNGIHFAHYSYPNKWFDSEDARIFDPPLILQPLTIDPNIGRPAFVEHSIRSVPGTPDNDSKPWFYDFLDPETANWPWPSEQFADVAVALSRLPNPQLALQYLFLTHVAQHLIPLLPQPVIIATPAIRTAAIQLSSIARNIDPEDNGFMSETPTISSELARVVLALSVLANAFYPALSVAYYAGIHVVMSLLRNPSVESVYDSFDNYLFPTSIRTISSITNAVFAENSEYAISNTLMAEIAHYIHPPLHPDPSIHARIVGATATASPSLFYTRTISAYILPVHPSHTVLADDTDEQHPSAFIIRTRDRPDVADRMGQLYLAPAAAPPRDSALITISEFLCDNTSLAKHDPILIKADDPKTIIISAAHIFAKPASHTTWALGREGEHIFFARSSSSNPIAYNIPEAVGIAALALKPHRKQHIILETIANNAAFNYNTSLYPVMSDDDCSIVHPQYINPVDPSTPPVNPYIIYKKPQNLTPDDEPLFIPHDLIYTTKFYDQFREAVVCYNTCAKLANSFVIPITTPGLLTPTTHHSASTIVNILSRFKDFRLFISNVAMRSPKEPPMPSQIFNITIQESLIDLIPRSRFPSVILFKPSPVHPLACIVEEAKTTLTRRQFKQWSDNLKQYITPLCAATSDLAIYHAILVRKAASIAVMTHNRPENFELFVNEVNDDILPEHSVYTDLVYSRRAPDYIKNYLKQVPHLHA